MLKIIPNGISYIFDFFILASLVCATNNILLGKVSTLAGKDAKFRSAEGITFCESDNSLLVCDGYKLRKVTLDGIG
jgi:hypothetical protein